MNENKHELPEGVTPEMYDFIKDVSDYLDRFAESDTEPNKAQIEKMKFCESVLKKITRGDNLSVEVNLDPTSPFGSVCVTGNNVRITNTDWFSRAAQFADNMAIEALVADAVRFEFTFYNVFKKKG